MGLGSNDDPGCYALKDRDRWIGWSASQRVVQNRRFLVLAPKGASSNLASQALGAAGWVKPPSGVLIRGLRGGVENRNHWRRAALMGEDRSRSRKPALLALLPDPFPNDSLPETREHLRSRPARSLDLIVP
jgi:hypothetical protein